MTEASCESNQFSEPTCPECSKEFETMRGMRVHHARAHGEVLPNRICTDCGIAFYDQYSDRMKCDECAPKQESDRDRWTYGNTEGKCIECDASFLYYPSEKPGRYCPDCVADDSVSCTPPQEHWGKGKTTVACDYCDEKFDVFRSKAAGQDVFFCDRECYAQWLSEDRSEKGVWELANNPNWVDGVNRDQLYGEGWSSARKAALDRDGYSCFRCGNTRDEIGRNPDVHHIEPARSFDTSKDAHILKNLVSLCRACHIEVERGTGQLDEGFPRSSGPS